MCATGMVSEAGARQKDDAGALALAECGGGACVAMRGAGKRLARIIFSECTSLSSLGCVSCFITRPICTVSPLILTKAQLLTRF